MLDKLKRRIVAKASADTVRKITKSSNEGRIRTISAIAEGIIFVGLILLSSKGGGKAAQAGITIIFNNSNVVIK